jgi:hypothetical protein
MKCHLYMRLADGAARRMGPFDIRDEAEARRMAQVELQRDAALQAVDIWWDNGELYRIERPAAPGAGDVGAAWARAFGGRRPDGASR